MINWKKKSPRHQKIEQLDQDKSASTARIGQVEKSIQAVQSAPSALNPAIGMVLDANVSHRSKDGGNFNFRSAEIGLAASVDPFARMYGFINGSSDRVEVDEAAAVTTSLPWNLTAKGGRFLADFGRFPKVHVHELPFVNEPLSVQRMIGGETQADGVEVNYLFPTPFFLRATLGGYNKIGEDNDQVDNNKSRSWSRFTYLGRLSTYFDLTDNHSIELGTSMAYTPSVRLAGNVDRRRSDAQRHRFDLSLPTAGQRGLPGTDDRLGVFSQQRTLRLRRCGQTPAILRRLQLR